jgi:RimJ/RimL family protein N-acetyltransferase
MPDLSDLDLLALEVATIWQEDARGRISLDARSGQASEPLLVIACGREGRVVRVGATVPVALADELISLGERGSTSGDLTQEPAQLAPCRELLMAEPVVVVLSSGPGYIVPPETQFAPTAAIVRSGDDVAGRHVAPPAGSNWAPDEWESLIAGDLGPFALAVADGDVASICHCSRIRQQSAEAGVWTHPEFRGRGLAASVAAAWARLVQQTGRIAFYSTSSENRSSQRVAARLGLRNIGWVWTLSAQA